MRKRSLVRAAALVAVVAATTACSSSGGGGGGASGSSAGIVPGDALAFVTVDTDLGSAQIASAKSVLDKFPFASNLLARIERSAASASGAGSLGKVMSSIGPETDAAVLEVAGKPAAVLLTKPKDVAAFTAALGAKAVSETVDGWTVVSDTQAALDAVKNRTSNLSDDASFNTAQKALPGDALATAYAAKAAFTQLSGLAGSTLERGALKSVSPSAGALAASKLNWLSVAATAHDAGVELELHVNTTTDTPTTAAESLAGELPAGALIALSFDGSTGLDGLTGSALSEAGSGATAALGSVQKSLGVSLQQLVALVGGPGILYVKPGAPLPELTLALEPADPAQAEQTLAKLAAKITGGAKPTTVTTGGVTLQSIALGPVSIFYGTWNGQLVVTDSQAAIGELQAKDNRLADDDTFKAAAKASGLAVSDPAWLYVDLKSSIPAAESLATLAGMKIPPSTGGNLEHLQSLVAYGTRDGQNSSAVLFLQTD